jgi:hypothetical protein
VSYSRPSRTSMDAAEHKSSPVKNNAGLCAECRHSREITSDRGSAFLLCELSFRDPHFAKYPALPVLACSGFAPLSDSNSTEI